MKGSPGSKGKKAVLPVVIDDIKKPHPGETGAFFKSAKSRTDS
jgi:hypothetical protein